MRQRLAPTRLLPILTLVALLVLAGPAAARNDKADVVAPKGKTYEGWPAPGRGGARNTRPRTTPSSTETGAACDEDQQGKVWFLAGNFGGETHRACTVPTDKALFFPIFNGWVDNVDPFGPPTELTEEELAEICEGFVADPSLLAVEIDGKPVKKLGRYAIDSTLFAYDMPEEDSLYDFLAPGNTFAGEVPEPGAIACGTYLLLEPLSKGHHDLRIQAANSDGSFSLDVTYDLTIKK